MRGTEGQGWGIRKAMVDSRRKDLARGRSSGLCRPPWPTEFVSDLLYHLKDIRPVRPLFSQCCQEFRDATRPVELVDNFKHTVVQLAWAGDQVKV